MQGEKNRKIKLNLRPISAVIFIDFKKAFDSVNRGILLKKLTGREFNPQITAAFADWL